MNLFLKYEGDLNLATENEIEHADRGMDPGLAKRIAEFDYKRRERRSKNGNKEQRNTQNAERSTKTVGGDSHWNDSLF